MNQLEYLTKVSGGWVPTAQDRISYLVMCLERDRLSHDSRKQIYREIEALRKEVEKDKMSDADARQEMDNWDAIHLALGVTAGNAIFTVARAEEISKWAKEKQEALSKPTKPEQHGCCNQCGGPCFAPMGECRRDDCNGRHVARQSAEIKGPPLSDELLAEMGFGDIEPPSAEDVAALQRIMAGGYSMPDAAAANRCLAYLRAKCKPKDK